MLRYLVCDVWCQASHSSTCYALLDKDFKNLYDHLDWLKDSTEKIYEACKTLTTDEREAIIYAFDNNNCIEELCNGDLPPIELSALPPVVQQGMKNLLEDFYKRLLNINQVPGEKLDYYNKLVKANKLRTCPICGLADIETDDSEYIEDYDHFFPKAHYPFAAVNFNNLVPTCDKCNKKHKGSKKPLDLNGKVYYPFDAGRDEIKVTLKLDEIDFDEEEKLTQTARFDFSGDTQKNETWNWLYNIEKRYAQVYREDTYSWLRALKKNIMFLGKNMEETIDHTIETYHSDRFREKKFLQIALLEELKGKREWMDIDYKEPSE